MNTTVAAMDHTYRVFLSYAHEDRPFAQRVARVLSYGAPGRVFTHDMLSPAEPWRERLMGELRECDVFVVIGSPRSATSDFVLQELGGAWAMDKPIVVVAAEEGATWRLPIESRMIEEVSLAELERPGVVQRLFAQLIRPRTEDSSHH